MLLIVVDLPAPLGSKRIVIRPLFAVSDRSSTALNEPYFFYVIDFNIEIALPFYVSYFIIFYLLQILNIRFASLPLTY